MKTKFFPALILIVFGLLAMPALMRRMRNDDIKGRVRGMVTYYG
jgi:hypothetical protein